MKTTMIDGLRLLCLTTLSAIKVSSAGTRRRLLLAWVLCLLPVFGHAHEQKAALTRIVFNNNTGNLEVMHRFFVHDAEHAARLLFDDSVNIIESVQSRELFANYVRNRFSLSMTNNANEQVLLQLDYVGQEIDRRFVWVYQEIAAPLGIKSLSVINSALKDVWADQSNLINVEKGEVVYSLDLSGSTDSGTVAIDN